MPFFPSPLGVFLFILGPRYSGRASTQNARESKQEYVAGERERQKKRSQRTKKRREEEENKVIFLVIHWLRRCVCIEAIHT